MLKIVLGVAFKVLETVFKKAAKNSQKSESGCSKIKDKCKQKGKKKPK
jgi:hypothetical protein